MHLLPLLALAYVGALTPTLSYAWGHTGHSLTAHVAMRLLSDTTKQHLAQLLPNEKGDLTRVSSWADEIKRTPRFGKTGPLHYSDAHDEPPYKCSYIFERDCPDGNCVTAAIPMFAAKLADWRDHGNFTLATADAVDTLDGDDDIEWIDVVDTDLVEPATELDKRHISAGDASALRSRRRQRRPPKGRKPGRRPPRNPPGHGGRKRRPNPPRRPPTRPGNGGGSQDPKEIEYTPAEAVKFLVHLVQDVHQPLHLTGRSRGGNDANALWGHAKTNLHAVWDTKMLEKALHDNFAGNEVTLATHLLTKVQGEWVADAKLWAACPAPGAKAQVPPSVLSRELAESKKRGTDQLTLAAPEHFRAASPATGVTPLAPPAGGLHRILCPSVWAQGIDLVNCAGVWDLYSEGVDLSGNYYEQNVATVLRLVAMGGVRLAAVLEAVFNPEGKM